MRITIPRWVQLVLIPVAIFLALYFARAASHAVFVFLISAIVALLLNPVVLAMGRVKCPRWLAVPVVYLAAIGIVVLIFIFLGPPLVRQFQRLFDAIPGWLDSLNGLLGDLETWLASHNIDVNLQINTSDIVNWLQTHGSQSVGALVTVGWSVVGFIVNLFLTVVVSFYMLIDGKRLFRFFCRLAPGGEPGVQEGLRARAAGRLQQVRARAGSARARPSAWPAGSPSGSSAGTWSAFGPRAVSTPCCSASGPASPRSSPTSAPSWAPYRPSSPPSSIRR